MAWGKDRAVAKKRRVRTRPRGTVGGNARGRETRGQRKNEGSPSRLGRAHPHAVERFRRPLVADHSPVPGGARGNRRGPKSGNEIYGRSNLCLDDASRVRRADVSRERAGVRLPRGADVDDVEQVARAAQVRDAPPNRRLGRLGVVHGDHEVPGEGRLARVRRVKFAVPRSAAEVRAGRDGRVREGGSRGAGGAGVLGGRAPPRGCRRGGGGRRGRGRRRRGRALFLDDVVAGGALPALRLVEGDGRARGLRLLPGGGGGGRGARRGEGSSGRSRRAVRATRGVARRRGAREPRGREGDRRGGEAHAECSSAARPRSAKTTTARARPRSEPSQKERIKRGGGCLMTT